MDTVTRVQILDETDCISHSTNTFGGVGKYGMEGNETYLQYISILGNYTEMKPQEPRPEFEANKIITEKIQRILYDSYIIIVSNILIS